ncbi:MAG TPA: DUF1634 domain-containing protein [Tepidisphaeraceae bacterium]|jgi:uncharacterized membrane protein|nr:DUF1634 domain-containing protein [Tepidisphaeraceae bacterium]
MAMNAMPPTPDTGANHADKSRQVEILISVLLRTGVVASLIVISAGMIVTFIHHPDYARSSEQLARLTKPGGAFPRSLGEMTAGLREFQGRAIVVAGLLLLIATPVMRVAVSIFAFVYEKDKVFVIVTSIVLALLLLSFFLGSL